MSVSITISVKDTATPALKARIEATSPKRLNAAVGPAVLRLTQRNFRTLPSNRRGWPTTGFWKRASKASSWISAPEGVLLQVNQIGVRQRWLGGDIKPTRKDALAIPIQAAAYGHTPSEFPGLFLMRTKKGAYLVLGKSGFGGLQFMFKLVAGVSQKANPNVLPTKEAYAAEASAAIVRALKPRGKTT